MGAAGPPGRRAQGPGGSDRVSRRAVAARRSRPPPGAITSLREIGPGGSELSATAAADSEAGLRIPQSESPAPAPRHGLATRTQGRAASARRAGLRAQLVPPSLCGAIVSGAPAVSRRPARRESYRNARAG